MKSSIGIAGACVLVWTFLGVAAAQPGTAEPDRVEISYVAPKAAEHQPILELLKERQVLESIKEYLSPLRLPQTLLIKVDECGGASNAWYDPNIREVLVCYEYIAEIVRNAPAETTEGITREDTIVGPTNEVFLHEAAHAIFDLLEIPVLGREEDAADQLAAFALLQLGPEEARRSIIGIAYMLSLEARAQTSHQHYFAKAHGLAAQRFYNLLCMAYGAHPDLFADIAKAALPDDRAAECGEEYDQVRRAFHKLIAPHLEAERQKKMTARKWLRFHPTPKAPDIQVE